MRDCLVRGIVSPIRAEQEGYSRLEGWPGGMRMHYETKFYAIRMKRFIAQFEITKREAFLSAALRAALQLGETDDVRASPGAQMLVYMR